MSQRTTIVLDEDCRKAAKDLARTLGCSTSEAIRRAIVRFRDLTHGVPRADRQRRVEALEHWIQLSADGDPDAEIARLKREDDGF